MVNYTFDYRLTPRVIFVELGDTEVTQQDLYNNIKDYEASPTGGLYPRWCRASGKEPLGGSQFVGITTTLEGAQVAFRPDTVPKETGTVTTPDASGTTLIDSTALFESNGVSPGALVVNFTDQSVAMVRKIISETEIEHDVLVQGSGNDWENGDVYKIWNTLQVFVTGGNPVAEDAGGSSIPFIFPTPFTQVNLTSSSSATLSDLQLQELKYRIEALKTHHTGYGTTIYWDPVNGSDTSNGVIPDTPVATFARAHSIAVDNNHDVIICIPGEPTGVTVVDEIITITKNYLFVRGPGRDFQLIPSSTTEDTVTITGNGVELSGMVVKTAGSGGKAAVKVDGGVFPLLNSLWIENANGNGIEITNSSFAQIDRCWISGSGTNGLLIGNTTIQLTLDRCEIHSNTNGITITGTGIEHCILSRANIYNNSNYGIVVGSGVNYTSIEREVLFSYNVNGNINDSGTNTYIEGNIGDVLDLLENKLTIDTVNSKLQLWNDAGDAVIREWALTDKDAGSIVLQGTGPANRGVPGDP